MTERYKQCEDFKMNVLGRIVRNLLEMDLERPYDSNFTLSERSTYAGNIYSAIGTYRKVCKGDESNLKILSGILGVDISDLELKTLAVSRGISEDDARRPVIYDEIY